MQYIQLLLCSFTTIDEHSTSSLTREVGQVTLGSSLSLQLRPQSSPLHQVLSSPRAAVIPPRTPTRTTHISPACGPLFSSVPPLLSSDTHHLSPATPPFSPVYPHLSPTALQFSPVGPRSSPVVQLGNFQEVQSLPETTEQGAIHTTPRPLALYGMKLVGDNIDWTIHPRFVRIDQQTQSAHYFNCYAVLDRIDLSSLSDVLPRMQPNMKEVISKVFPNAHEESVMHDDFAVLLARMLCSHMTYFRETFADVIDWHIQHRYSAEMSTKSEVVCGCYCHNF